jgi:hypothetical protein
MKLIAKLAFMQSCMLLKIRFKLHKNIVNLHYGRN